MDGGFRAPRPVERRAAARPAHRQAEESQPIGGEPKPAHRAAMPHHATQEEKPKKRFLWPIIAAVVVILGAVGWFAWSNIQGGAAIDGSKYQAVFFTNGQVYFGKLHAFNGEYMKLTDVFYLQNSQQSQDAADSKNPQATSTDQNQQLIKLGREVHGPEDEMIISKDQVLFYENLKPDGTVTESINKYKKSN